ncbi:MAG: hypothetical protein AAGJ18_07420 [Bacteroidota bacterium]
MKEQLAKDKYMQLTYELHQTVVALESQQIDIKDSESGWFNIDRFSPDEEIIYLPDSVQEEFKRFAKNPVKLYKICNFGKPASSIKYNRKHQYSTERLIESDLHYWYNTLKNRIRKANEDFDDENQKRLKVGIPFSESDIQEHKRFTKRIKDELGKLDDVFDNFDKYEVVQSSFFKNYHYTMMNFQYFRDMEKKFGTTQLVKPILKPVYNKSHEITSQQPKTNIIFLDMARIQQPSIKTSEKVRAYLGGFETVVNGGRRDLFVKKKF